MKARLVESMFKLSAPEVSGMVERERLFTLLDRGLEKPVIWVAAPAGSGKTTLVSGWLHCRGAPYVWYQVDAGDGDPATFFMYLGLAAWKAAPEHREPLPSLSPEYLLGIPVFTRRFFAGFFSRLPPSAVLVLDNYQDAPADSLLHTILRYGIEAAPPGAAFIVLSRREPPTQLSRLRIANRLHFIRWPDLRFSLFESKTLALSHGCGAVDDEVLLRLHQRTDGWAAGLALLLRSREQCRSRGPLAETRGILFDYFAEEVLSQTNGATRDFLLKTSFLSSMTVRMAERITGNDGAGEVLDRFCREHYFIESYANDEVVYKYHPLFREFLHNSACTAYSPEEAGRILLLAAELLLENGHFDDAGDMLCECGKYEGLITLILARAQTMIDHGRLVRLQRWLSSIPVDRLWREPWLCYWSGVCSHPFDLAASECFFGEAFRLFRDGGFSCEALLAWAGTVACIITEWMDFAKLDPWIAELTEEADRALDATPPELRARIAGLMLICLTFRQPQHAKIGFYEEKAAGLLDAPLQLSALLTISSHLLTHYTKMGYLVKARAVIDLIEPRVPRSMDPASPEYILWHTVRTSYFALSGDKPQCLRDNRNGLALAADSGIHIYDIFMLFFGAMAGFIDSDRTVIDEYLERISGVRRKHGLILPIIHRQILGWKCLMEEDYARAREHVDAAMQQTLRLGSAIEHAINRICFSLVLFEQGRHEDARNFLGAGSSSDYPENSAYIIWMRRTTEAYFSFREGDEAAGVRQLREAMAIGARHRIFMHHYWSGKMARYLCAKAVEAGIEPAYTRELANRHGISPDPVDRVRFDPSAPVVIHTLGRFQILLENGPLGSGRKARKKPLELLKAVIAFGGQDVTKQTICDSLWPEVEGDRANNSFKFTLHQLRRLLKYDGALAMRNGQLAFNYHYCWIDALVFMELSGNVIHLCRKDRHDTAGSGIGNLARQAIDIYGGDFLPSDTELPWTAPARQRLRDRMLRMLHLAGKHMEDSNLWEEALFFYEKSLEIDDAREEACRCVMRCCAALGRTDLAIAAYRKCRSAVFREFAAQPTAETERFYRSLVDS